MHVTAGWRVAYECLNNMRQNVFFSLIRCSLIGQPDTDATVLTVVPTIRDTHKHTWLSNTRTAAAVATQRAAISSSSVSRIESHHILHPPQ